MVEDAVTAVAFHAVQAAVRVPEQPVEVRGGRLGHADTQGDAHAGRDAAPGMQPDELLEVVAAGAEIPGGPRAQQHEFLAAVARGDVAGAGHVENHAGHALQHEVTGLVAPGVIHDLEVVDVDQRGAQGGVVGGGLHEVLALGEEVLAVGEAGQVVGAAQFADAGVQGAQFLQVRLEFGVALAFLARLILQGLDAGEDLEGLEVLAAFGGVGAAGVGEGLAQVVQGGGGIAELLAQAAELLVQVGQQDVVTQERQVAQRV